MAAITWDGGAGTSSWFDSANWSNNVLPGATDDVTIPASTLGAIVMSGASARTATVNTLTTARSIRLGANVTLDVAGALTVTGSGNSLTLEGGTLRRATFVASSESALLFATSVTNRLDGVTITTDLRLTDGANVMIQNGISLSPGRRYVFSGSFGVPKLYFDGDTTINRDVLFDTNGAIMGLVGSGTLTIGAGVTVSGGTAVIGSTASGAGNIITSVINRGTIRSTLANRSITIAPVEQGVFQNEGVLDAAGGSLNLSRIAGRLGGPTTTVTGSAALTVFSIAPASLVVDSIAVSGAGVLTLNDSFTIAPGAVISSTGPDAILNIGSSFSTWTNQGQIRSQDGTVVLTSNDRGWTSPGSISLTNSRVQLGGAFNGSALDRLARTGGSLVITGTIDNAGHTLALSAATGDYVLQGGLIRGGSISTSDGARLVLTPGQSNRFDSVDLAGDLVLNPSEPLTIIGRLGLPAGAKIRLGALSRLELDGQFPLERDVVFEGDNATLTLRTEGVLTISPGVVIRSDANGRIAGGFSRITVVNRGTIRVAPGRTMTIGVSQDTVVSSGRIELGANANLTVSGLFGDVAGDFDLSGTSVLNLSGTRWNAPNIALHEGARASLGGTFVIRSGTTITAAGAGTALNLGDMGSWTNAGSIVANGSAVNLGGAGSWTNAGAIQLTSCAVTLGGTFDAADLIGMTRTGGTTDLTGTLINEGEVFEPADIVTVRGGIIIGGAVVNTPVSGVRFAPSTFAMVRRVEFRGELLLGPGIFLRSEGSTFGPGGRIRFAGDRASTLELGLGDAITCNVAFETSGANEFSVIRSTLSVAELTIAPGVIISGGGGSVGASATRLVNYGTIRADAPGRVLRVVGSQIAAQAGSQITASNGGAIEVTNIGAAAPGALSVSGAGSRLTLLGSAYAVPSLEAPPGTTLELLGSFAIPSGSSISAAGPGATLVVGNRDRTSLWTNAGSVTMQGDTTLVVGGLVTTQQLRSLARVGRTGQADTVLVGALNNAGEVLALSDATGSLRLDGGVIRGGAVAAADGFGMRFSSNDANLIESVQLPGDLVLADGGRLQVNGLDIPPSAAIRFVGATGGRLVLVAQTTLRNNVHFLTDSNAFTSTLFFGAGGSIAPGVAVSGGNGVIAVSGPLTNQGDIIATSPGRSLQVQNGVFTFSNAGSLQALAGGRITIFGPFANFNNTTLTGGSYVIDPGSTITLNNNTFPIRAIGPNTSIRFNGPGATLTGLGALASNAGSISLLGGFDLSVTPAVATFTNTGALTLGPGSTLSVLAQGQPGNFTQSPTGTLEIQLGGLSVQDGFGSVRAAGSASLAGTLSVSLVGGFRPGVASFDILSAASVSGSFSSLRLPPSLRGPGQASLDLLSSVARLNSNSTLDSNHDGVVNPDDLSDFIAGYFSTPPDQRTDLNGDGVVDPDDLADFIAMYFA